MLPVFTDLKCGLNKEIQARLYILAQPSGYLLFISLRD